MTGFKEIELALVRYYYLDKYVRDKYRTHYYQFTGYCTVPDTEGCRNILMDNLCWHLDVTFEEFFTALCSYYKDYKPPKKDKENVYEFLLDRAYDNYVRDIVAHNYSHSDDMKHKHKIRDKLKLRTKNYNRKLKNVLTKA